MAWSAKRQVTRNESQKIVNLLSDTETKISEDAHTRRLLATGGHAYQLLALPYNKLRALTQVATQLLHHSQPLFFVGPRSTNSQDGGSCRGVERLALDHVLTQLDTDRYTTQRVLMCDPSLFGAPLVRTRIASSLTQQSKEKMQPPKQKQMVIYIDDLHLDSKFQGVSDDETADGSDSIEAVRELIEQRQQFVRANDLSLKDTYHNRSMVRMQVEDLNLAGTSTVDRFARVQPGAKGGVDNRLRRQFNVFHIPETNWNSLAPVFSHVVHLVLSASTLDNHDRFSAEVVDMASDIGNATLGVFMDVEAFLKKRARANGTTCSEDASIGTIMPLVSILQGITFTSTTAVSTTRGMVRLWLHECTRVIEGRVRDKANIIEFRRILHYNMLSHFCLHFPLHKAHKHTKKAAEPDKFNLSATFEKLLHQKVRRALLHWRALSWLDHSSDFASGHAQKNEILFSCVRSLKPASHLIGENVPVDIELAPPASPSTPATPDRPSSTSSTNSRPNTTAKGLRIKNLKGKLRGATKKIAKPSASIVSVTNQATDERKRMRDGGQDDSEPLHDMHEELYNDMKTKIQLMLTKDESDYYVDLSPSDTPLRRLSMDVVQEDDQPPLPLGPKNEHGLPRRVMLFDHTVRDVVRLSNTIVQSRASAMKCCSGTGIIVTCPPHGGKGTTVALTAKLMQDKLVTRDMTEVGSTPEAWKNFLVELLSLPVVDTTVINGSRRKCGIIFHLTHAETACTRALQDLLRLVRTSTCGLTQPMIKAVVKRLGFRADGIPLHETMAAVQNTFRRRVAIVLSCTSLIRGGEMNMNINSVGLRSQPSSLVAESQLWLRLSNMCHVYALQPLPEGSVTVFSRSMLAEEALVTHITKGTIEPYLFLPEEQEEKQTPDHEEPNKAPSEEQKQKKKVKKKKGKKEEDSIIFTKSQIQFLCKVERCAGTMHHYMTAEMRWPYAPLALMRRCLALFWRLVVRKTPVMFENYRRISATARKYEESEVVIKENVQFIEDLSPVLITTSALQADLSEQMRQAEEEELEQQELVKEAEDNFIKQQNATMKVTEQVKKELALVEPPLLGAIKSIRKIKQGELDEV